MRKKLTIQRYLEKQFKIDEENRYLRNLAEALILRLQIPEGHGLVSLLGSGYEHTNREALFHWLREHQDEIYVLQSEGKNPLAYLEQQLCSLEHG